MKTSILWDIKPRSSFIHSTFRKNLSPPSSLLKSMPSKKSNMKQLASTDSLTLKMEEACSSETSINSKNYTALYPRRQLIKTNENFIHNWRIFKCHTPCETRNLQPYTWIFSSPRRPGRLWGPPSLLSNGYGGSFPGGKAAGAWRWPLISN
jgi:hypothetical protein